MLEPGLGTRYSIKHRSRRGFAREIVSSKFPQEDGVDHPTAGIEVDQTSMELHERMTVDDGVPKGLRFRV